MLFEPMGSAMDFTLSLTGDLRIFLSFWMQLELLKGILCLSLVLSHLTCVPGLLVCFIIDLSCVLYDLLFTFRRWQSSCVQQHFPPPQRVVTLLSVFTSGPIRLIGSSRSVQRVSRLCPVGFVMVTCWLSFKVCLRALWGCVIRILLELLQPIDEFLHIIIKLKAIFIMLKFYLFMSYSFNSSEYIFLKLLF